MGKETNEATKKAEAVVASAFDLVEVPTQTTVVIRDNSTGSLYDTNQAIVKLLNDVAELKKGLL